MAKRFTAKIKPALPKSDHDGLTPDNDEITKSEANIGDRHFVAVQLEVIGFEVGRDEDDEIVRVPVYDIAAIERMRTEDDCGVLHDLLTGAMEARLTRAGIRSAQEVDRQMHRQPLPGLGHDVLRSGSGLVLAGGTDSESSGENAGDDEPDPSLPF